MPVQVSFYNVQDLMEARKEVLPLARRNAQREETVLGYDSLQPEQRAGTANRLEDFLDNIVEVGLAQQAAYPMHPSGTPKRHTQAA